MKLNPSIDLNGYARSVARAKYRRHRRFAHQWMSRHAVDHIALRAKPQHFFGHLRIHFSELLCLLVNVIEAMHRHRRRQSLQRGMSRRAHVDVARAADDIPGAPRQQRRIARAKSNNRDCHVAPRRELYPASNKRPHIPVQEFWPPDYRTIALANYWTLKPKGAKPCGLTLV